MIRLIPKLFAGLVALAILLVGVLAVALPRVINTEEFRAALRNAVIDVLGTPVEWSRLEAGLLPLRLIIKEPVLLAAKTNREDASLTATSIDLRLSLPAMLDRRVEVDSLVLHGVELVVTRTQDGFILPLTNGLESEGGKGSARVVVDPNPEVPEVSEVSEDTSSPGDALVLAFRRFAVTQSRVIVRDRTLPRPIDWELSALEFEAVGESLENPLDVEFSASLASNAKPFGGLRSRGTITADGIFDLNFLLDEVLLAEFQPYVSDAGLTGEMSGLIQVGGVAEGLSFIETDLRIENLAVKSFGLDLAGRLDLKAKQHGEEPISFEAVVGLGADGGAVIAGELALDGSIDAKIDMRDLELARFTSLTGEEIDISGRATGLVKIGAKAEGELSYLTTALRVTDARYSDAALKVAGVLDLKMGLEGLGATDPVRFEFAMDLEGGGHVDAAGTATLDGAVDAKLNVASVDLRRLAAWVPESTQLEGELRGQADVRLTSEGHFERLVSNFRIVEARVVSGSLDVGGVFDFSAGPIVDDLFQLSSKWVFDDKSEIAVSGSSTGEGVVDVNLKLKAFDLVKAVSFLPDPEMRLAGLATGSGRWVGEMTVPEFVSFDVGVENGLLKTGEYSVEGPFLAKVKVQDPMSRPRGRIDLDLTSASLVYLNQYTKAAGMSAEVTTRFVPEESGEILFESQLKLRNIDEILLQEAIGEMF